MSSPSALLAQDRTSVSAAAFRAHTGRVATVTSAVAATRLSAVGHPVERSAGTFLTWPDRTGQPPTERGTEPSPCLQRSTPCLLRGPRRLPGRPSRRPSRPAQPGRRGPGGLNKEQPPSLAKEQPVECHRCQDQARGGDPTRQDGHVEPPLAWRQRVETAGERHGEQEPGEDLHAGLSLEAPASARPSSGSTSFGTRPLWTCLQASSRWLLGPPILQAACLD